MRIQELYTFHVVVKNGAMQDAARELGVTPSAISQRIRALEERQGRRLFERSKNGISLTLAGRALHADVGGAFCTIEAAHAKQPVSGKRSIRISTTASFAHAMLVSSLGRFMDRYPALNVMVETTDAVVDLKSEPVDLAIRHGLGTYAGLSAQRLCAPELLVVASPALLQKYGPVRTPADCLRFKLLPDATGKDWEMWLQAQGIDPARVQYGPRFDNDFLTVKAAQEGQGLALLNDVYVREALAKNQLQQAVQTSWPTRFAYYAVARPEVMARPAVMTLVNWLQTDLAPAATPEA